jgi:hypothetical protein
MVRSWTARPSTGFNYRVTHAPTQTAQDRYTEWVGLYGTGSTVVIQVLEETDGRERVRRKWTAQGEVENLTT